MIHAGYGAASGGIENEKEKISMQVQDLQNGKKKIRCRSILEEIKRNYLVFCFPNSSDVRCHGAYGRSSTASTFSSGTENAVASPYPVSHALPVLYENRGVSQRLQYAVSRCAQHGYADCRGLRRFWFMGFLPFTQMGHGLAYRIFLW